MTRIATASTLFACLALLSACNTTDALTLTPLVDIGGSSSTQRSSPVSQGEAEQMAGASSRRQAFAVESRQGSGGYHPAYVEQPAYVQQPRQGSGAPPTTMDEQALALQNESRSPAVSAPIQSQPLSEPVSNAQAEEEDMVEQPAAKPEQTAMVRSAPAQGSATVRFLPIIGAPVQAVTPLSRQLGNEARSHGLSIKSSNDNSSAYILKGYLSAFTDSGNVTVVYVWDVLDNSGARLHRIQGQEQVPSSAQDPWAGVPASVMQQIASRTISEFSSWREGRGG
ncbi:hypothetical protein ASE04_13115 [Rhizobium sp. Root708]|uniref:hypothetical protein n=1 Tax=Rhizobium sp. Root708 TaxID=1736592 RepID=UPI0006FE2E3D|nr:hypothetical protein [Rhizobium sp. Root708]KRB50855.1 hypothetical protein ASE04_13115 [Rhizobium sp. Root708]